MWEESFVAMHVLLGEDGPTALDALAAEPAARAATLARALSSERPRAERAARLAKALAPIARAVRETALA